MTPSPNILDHISDCIQICEEDFPGQVTPEKSWQGAEGYSTSALIVTLNDGSKFLVEAKRLK